MTKSILIHPMLDRTEQRAEIRLRSLVIGAAGVLALGALAPFNDLVLNGSAFVGGALPMGATLLFLCFIIVMNGPLNRFRPGMALNTQELLIVYIMFLVGSAVPTRGLMQMWPASLAGVWRHSAANPDYKTVIEYLALPDWFWPRSTAEHGPTDPLIAWFGNRIPSDEPASVRLQILRHWMPPVAGWSIFFAGMALAIIGLSIIVAKQWIENERLPFPITTIQMALVEAPAPGRWLNATLTSRSFLIGAGVILAIRLLDGLNRYFPKIVPTLGLNYNLRGIFVEPPFSYVDLWLTAQTIYPLVIAITYFISSKIAFSLWVFVVLSQIPSVLIQSSGGNMTPHRSEINLGALLMFAMMILYSGRKLYWQTLKMLVSRVKTSREDARFFIHLRTAGWMAVVGMGVAVTWLCVVGMPAFPAVLLVGSLILIWIVMAAVVAHSGLLVCNTLATPHEWFSKAFTNPGGLTSLNLAHLKTQFFAQFIGGLWAYNSDHLSVYTTHSLKLGQTQNFNRGKRLLVAIAVALVLAFGASFLSALFCQYHFATTADVSQAPINSEILDGQPKWAMEHTVRTMRGALDKARSTSSPLPWVAGSAVLTGILAIGQLRYSAWPLHPIGLLMVYSFPIRRLWFSIFLGWVIKALIVRFGGAGLYRSAMPLFIGVVIGEIIASAGFAFLAMILWAMGIDFRVVNFLPTSQY